MSHFTTFSKSERDSSRTADEQVPQCVKEDSISKPPDYPCELGPVLSPLQQRPSFCLTLETLRREVCVLGQSDASQPEMIHAPWHIGRRALQFASLFPTINRCEQFLSKLIFEKTPHKD